MIRYECGGGLNKGMGGVWRKEIRGGGDFWRGGRGESSVSMVGSRVE